MEDKILNSMLLMIFIFLAFLIASQVVCFMETPFPILFGLNHFPHEQMENVKDKGDEALYDKLDSAYPSDDENYEVALSAIITPTVSKKNL